MITTIGRWALAPDLIEPIVGYRAWRYTARERAVQLFPITVTDLGGQNAWEGAWSGSVRASCPTDEGTHLAPDERCSCGFYAMKTPDADDDRWRGHALARSASPASTGTGLGHGSARQ